MGNVCLGQSNIVLAGDFNMPQISWDTPEKTLGSNENAFVELLHDHFLEQLNTTPTRGNNTLDIVLTNIPNKVKICEILSPVQAELFTDHNIIAFELSMCYNQLPKICRTVYNYRQGDFAGLRSALECLNLDSLITTDNNINHDWQQWKKEFLEAVSQYIPSMRVKGRNYVPWMNSTILRNIKKKNSLRLRIKKSPKPTEYLVEKFKTLRSSIKRMLRNCRSIYFDSICSSRGPNPKRFWSLFKLNNKSRNIPEKLSAKVTETERIFADNPADIAALFNNYFTSTFTIDPKIEVSSPDALPGQSDNTIIENITLSEADVFSVLYNLDINKAQGPDGIPARLLKETARQIAPSLTLLFNKSLSTGVLPRDWKLANVVPVYKKDTKEHVENYRPISFLSLISKALERCVFNKIKDHVFDQINDGQHGFVPRKSCVTQLIEVFDYIGRELDLGKQVDVIYLDMSKAFDRVSHMQLLKRLRDFGFGGNTLNWFRSYLKDRRQQTTVLGATSSALPVTSGVPQGSILGPLLFLLYQNNHSNSINHSKIATFADDTKIYKVINKEADASAMENDLANFQTPSANANLLLNTDKCKTLRITRKRNKINHNYKLQDSALKITDYERDLGVWTSSTLTWSKQVLHQCAQANRSLGYIRRSTIKIKTISVRRMLYLTLVRSHLAYASQVWAPQSVDLIKHTERVQRRASKYILDLPFFCDINYNHRLSTLNLLPLCCWHEYLDILFLFKSHHNIINLSNDRMPHPQHSSQRTRSANPKCLQFETPACKTSTYQKSYLIRATRVWNTLPKDLTINGMITLKEFRKMLYNYYETALDKCYDVDDPRTWKSVCIKCNQARDLTRPITCCF